MKEKNIITPIIFKIKLILKNPLFYTNTNYETEK